MSTLSDYVNMINKLTDKAPKASEPSASLSSTSAYQANLKTTAPANNNWYSGSKPTYAEAYGRIMEIGQKDPTAARSMWDNLQTLRKDPTSVYYNPYTQPTNQAVNEFRNLGAQFNTVNDEFYEGFGFLKAFYNTGTTNNPTSPGKNATPQEQAAYQYYQILKAEDKTKKAEREWAALQEELGYWAKRKDLNLSDDDIIKKINWKNYSTLAEMDESAAGGFPIELNRAVGYSQDAMRGVLWAARNGSSGDTDRDAAYAALGYGNQWQMDTDIAKKMDATSDSYAPFAVGCNMDEEAVYFGVDRFDQKWVDAKRNILNGEDETAKKYYANVAKTVQETEEAKAQWERFQSEIQKKIERSDSPEKALQKLEDTLGDSDYAKLAKLRKAEETGEHIDITDSVGFGWNIVRQMVNDGFANKDTRSLSEKSAASGTNIPDTRDKTANAAADTNLNDSLDDIELNGTDADKARAKAAPKASYDADVDGAMNVTVTDPEAASRAVTDSAAKDYLENYFTIGGVNYNYTTAEANVGAYTKRRDELLASLGEKAQAALNARRDNGLLEGVEGVTDTMPIIDQLREYTTQDGRYEIHTHFDGAKYVFDYAIDNYDADRENLTEDDLNAETAEGFARGFLDDILAGQQNLVDLTDEEKQTVADIRQLNALIERDQKYMTEHEAEYKENTRKRREYEDRMLASMGTSRDAWGTVKNQDARYCFAVGDYLAATCSNYAATVWSEYDAAQSIQNAMQEGSTPEQIDQAVQTARKNIETELKNVEEVRAYLERTGTKLRDDYSKNLDRHENKLKRDLQDLDMYDLRKNDDYAEMVAKGAELAPTVQGYETAFLDEGLALQMNADEKNNFYYFLAKDGLDAAMEYFDYLADPTYGVLNTRLSKNLGEDVSNLAQSSVLGFIGANALEILSQPGKLFGAAYAWGAGLFGEEVNPYNLAFTANTVATSALQGSKEAISNISGGSGTFMDDILQGLYDIVINRANSAVMGSLTGAFGAGDAEETARGFIGFLKNAWKETAHAIPMGLGAGADTWREIKISGGSDTQAMAISAITTLSETITEGVSLENMREAFGSSVFSPVTIKEFLKNWLTKAGVSEAIGETINDAIENLADEAIMGDLSDHDRNVFAYQCEGYGVDEAEAMARRDEIKGLMRTALVSYLTPGLDIIGFYQNYNRDSRYVKGWSRLMGEDLTKEQTVEEIRALREDRENWVKNKLAQRLAPAGEALQTAQESAQETPQESTQEPVNEPSEEEQFRIDFERKLRTQYKDQALLAASKNTNDSTERTAILTALFMNSANPADDIQAAEARELAEAAAVMLNASLGDDALNIFSYLQYAWKFDIDADALKQAIQNGILSGNSEVFGMLTGQNVEFNEANILARTQMLYEAGMRDAQNQTVVDGVRNAVRESRISKQVQNLIAQGAMGEVQNAKKKLNTAKENVRLAEKNYTEKSNDLKEKKNQLRSIKEQFLNNPGDDNMKNEMTRLTGEVTRAAAVENEYRQSLENARKGLTDAQSDYDRISKENYASLRAQAETAVNAEDEQRGIVRAEAQAAVQAQQQAQAEAQRIEDEESGKMEELSDEQKIRQRVDRIKADRNLSDEEANDLYNRYMRINEAAKTKDLNMLVSDPQAKKLIGRMARRLGVRIITGETGAAKGVYRNGTIILSNKLTVADAVLETAMHEVTHSLEQTKSYKTYAKIAIESMYGSEDSAAYHEAANRIAQDWAANGKELDADGIRSELVAEFTREHLSDRDTIERLLDNGLGYTIRNALHKINEFFQSIRHMFGDNPPKEIDAFKQAEQAFKDAINERKNTAVHPQAEQFSVPQLAQAAGYVFDEATTAMYRPGDIDENGKVREGAKPVEKITAKDIQNSPLGMLVDTAVTLNPVNFTTYKRGEDGRYMSDENGLIVEKSAQQTADEINQMFADLATMCCKYRDNNLVWEIAASTLESQFSAIKSNSDDQYGTTVDFGTVCAKTQALINALSRDMVKLGRGLTQAEIMDVYNDVYQADLTVPCPVCYVFSRWMGVPGMLESIRQYQNRFLGEDKNGNILNDRDTIQRMVDEYVANVKDKYYVPGKTDSDGNELTLAKQYSNAKSRITQRINNQETSRMDAVRELNAYSTGNYGALLAFHRENVNAAQRAYDRAVSENKPEKTIVNKLKALNSAKKNLTAFETLAKNQDESAVAKKREAAQKKLDRALAAKETAMQELNEMEAFNWLTQVLCHEEGDRFVVDDDYKRVPDDVLLDLNRTSDFVKYEATWKYRTSRGAGMGKAILPYSGASIGDSLSGVSRWSEDENPVLAKDSVGIGRAIANKIASVRAQNLIGGQRFQSTSDYRPEWGLDYMMTFLEQQCLGSKGQLYTKVIEAVDLLASAGIDVNLSLMGAGDGYVTDENGNKHLVFSDVTGINFDQAYEKTLQYDNVQMILVGFNDDHIRLALADDRIDFIIPWHSSGNSDKTVAALMSFVGETQTNSKDYSPFQNDKVNPDATEVQKNRWNIRTKIITGAKLTDTDVETIDNDPILKRLYDRFNVEGVDPDCYHVKLNSKQADHIFPYEYWDKSLTKEQADQNGKNFVDYCEAMGMIPRFEAFKNDKGYWKLLIDRRMYDRNGNYRDQQTINVANTSISQLPNQAQAKYRLDSNAQRYQQAFNAFDERMGLPPDIGAGQNAFQNGMLVTDADIMQDLVDNGIITQGDADFATPRMGAVGMLADTVMQNGKNTNPVGLKSGQRIISDLMQSLGLTADARHARYDRSKRNATLGYTYQDSVIHIQDAQNVITAAHELGHIFDKVFDMQKYTKDWQTLKDNYIKLFKGGDAFLGGYSPDRVNGEIMAEFTAAYMYDRNSAVKMAGEDFVNHFEEDLSKKGWLKPFQQASEEAQKWINASASARAQAVVQLELPKEKVDDKLESVGRKLFDRTLPLLKLTNAAKESGYYSADTDARTLKLAQDSMIANLTHACLTEKLRDPKGNVVTDKDGVEYGSLKDILNQVDAKDEKVFNTYWLLLHAQDRQNLTDENGNNVGKAVFSKRVDVDTAINEIKAQHKDFDEIIEQAEEWYTQFMQTWLVDQGLLSQKDFDTMRRMYPHYVPTFRTKDDYNKVIDTAISRLHGDVTQSPVRRARGSEADIYNPVMGMAEYVQKYVSYQKQVETLRAFSDQMDAVLDGAIDGILPFAEPAQKDMAFENNKRSNDEVRNAVWDQAAAEVMGGEMTIDALNRIEAVMEKISDTSAWLMPTATGEDVINVPMADGTVKSWVVYDKAMFEALAQMPPVKRNAVVRAFSACTNFLAKMATGLNIKFSGQNFFSDSETAMNTGHAGWWRSLLPGYAISQITTAFNYAVNKAKDARGKETSKAYQDFQIFGLTGSRYLLNDKNSQRSLRRELYKGSFKAMNALQKAGRAISTPVRAIGSITEFFEEVTRFNEFLHSRTDSTDYAGLLEAGKNSREVTVDFSKRGTADMSYARAFIPFIGAQMQGIYKTLRMFSSENTGNRVKTAVRIVANGIMTNLLMTAWKNLTWDDDDKEDYELLSPYEANKYWHIKVGKGQFLRVKRSQDALLQLADQIGTFIGNVVTEYDNDPFGQLYAGALEIVKGMKPGVDSNILSPISDANHNETWWGGQIDSASDLEKNVLQRYDEDTSTLGVVFSALSNTIGLQWSPKTWDYVIQQYTGSLGAFGLATIRRAADGEAIPAAMWNHFKEEIVKSFSINPVKSNGISSAFYDSKNTLSEIVSSYEAGIMPATVKGGMEEEAYQEAKRLLEKGGEINKAQAKAGNLWKKYNALEDNPNLTESQKNEAQMEVRREINATLLDAQEIIDEYRNKYTHGIPALDSITAVINFFNHAKSPEAEYHDPIEEMHPYLQQSAYADQFKSVFNKTYDTNMLPHPSASRTIDKETYTIPEELWDEYNDYYIERYDDKIDDLLDGREWDDLTDNEQIEILKSAHTYANTLNAKWKREIKEYHE